MHVLRHKGRLIWLKLECLDMKSHISQTALHSLDLFLPPLLVNSSEPRDTENMALTIMSLSNPSTPLDQMQLPLL